MAAQKRVFVSQEQSRDQNLKNHFPNGFFNEIWIKVGEHEYIYISEIKFEKKNVSK